MDVLNIIMDKFCLFSKLIKSQTMIQDMTRFSGDFACPQSQLFKMNYQNANKLKVMCNWYWLKYKILEIGSQNVLLKNISKLHVEGIKIWRTKNHFSFSQNTNRSSRQKEHKLYF